MKVLLIGPYPPPHGGISVHMAGVYRRLTAAGTRCISLDPHRCGGKIAFAKTLLRYTSEGWTIQLHTNGHNVKSWILAFVCGFAARIHGTLRNLTLHSGMAPGYLNVGFWRRKPAELVCGLYDRVTCVSPAIRDAIVSIGVPSERIDMTPAYFEAELKEVPLDSLLLAWIGSHQPLFSTTLFFRPEYGVDLLVEALKRLRPRYPSLGCLVMGSGEQYHEAVKRIRDAGFEDAILLLGDVEHDRCLALMARSNVFLRPTLEDGDSISVREASALGVPVVASRVGTRPDGVILFRRGDVEDLHSKIELALSSQRGEATPQGGLNGVAEPLCLDLK
jgi:glycogen(starch) synthase